MQIASETLSDGIRNWNHRNNGAEYPATDAESDYCITVAGIGGGWQNQRKQGKNRNGIILCSGEKCYLWRLFPGGSDTKTIRAADTIFTKMSVICL